MKKLITAAIASMMFASTANAEPMIDGIDSNMTRAQVIQKYEGTKRYSQNRDEVKDFTYYQDNKAIIEIKYQSGTDETRKIRSVSIEGWWGFDAVKARMIEKYGQPISETVETETYGKNKLDRTYTTWKSEGMMIVLRKNTSSALWKLKMTTNDNSDVNL